MNETIEKIKTGDTQTFSQVYNNFSSKLYNFVYAKSGSEFYANEVVQITFMKLWERRQKLNTEVELAVQLYQIAKTTLIDVLRKVEKDRLRESACASRGDQTNYGYERLKHRDANYTLQHAISQMPPVRKKVFSLRMEEQLSYKEIAITLALSVKTVNKHMELAMKQIKPAFKVFSIFLIILLASH